MQDKKPSQLTQEAIDAINRVLLMDDRVEVIPVKDGGVKVLHIKRREVKQ